jgi:hypothetical protein
MSFSLKYKILHVHIPKNAGHTINRMTPVDVFPQLPYDPNLRSDPLSFHCGAAELYRNYVGTMHWEEFHSFALSRNPWDRMVSGWKYCMPDLSFESFVKNLDAFRSRPTVLWHVITTQKKHVSDYNGVIVNKIGRMENLDNFMLSLSREWDFPLTETEHLNATVHNHYTEYYNDELIDIVAKRFREDIELFEYSFGE